MANIDPKTHGTKFDLKHAFLISVLMTDGDVNLPHLMRDILLVRPTKHPNHLLPFPVFIMPVANRHEVPKFPDDKFYVIRQDHLADQLPQPETSAAPSARAQYSLEPTMHDIMRQFDRHDRQIATTQAMIRRAFPQTNFSGLGFSSSSDDSESQDS
ncbi:hypothetical protein PIB30_022128 [Stylosanthes scabra]|uniref:Uncharacterized protein n=1 Tax=Stylosanthes scabra TaxID=79078 RepID=A0ABU6T9T1_9FABA|nr:hypothetical protein [Stylosanthes scabra]